MPWVTRSVRHSIRTMSLWFTAMGVAGLMHLPAAWGEGDQLVLTRPWARLRARPAEASRSIAVVYGNDVLAILARQDGWLKVRTAGKQEGWLSPNDASGAGPAASRPGTAPRSPTPGSNTAFVTTAGGESTGELTPSRRPGTGGRGPQGGAVSLPPPPPLGGSPSSPDTLRRMGYSQAARSKLTQVLLDERDTPMAYLATRDMLAYHPVGDLPPLQGGRIPPELRNTANSLRVSVLLQEGQQLVKEGKPWDAVFLYQAMVQNDPDNGRAYLELLDLLTRLMVQATNSPTKENLGLAASIWRSTYPDLPLPPMVEDQLSGKKK